MTPTDEIASLRAEVAGLRRQGRIVLVLVALVLLGVLVIAWGRRPGARPTLRAEDDASVQAQEFRLVDPDGNLRGIWNCPPAGPYLTILDGHGRPLFQLRQSPEGGVLQLNDATGRAVFKKP